MIDYYFVELMKILSFDFVELLL